LRFIGRGIGHHRASALARRGSQNQPERKLLYVAAPGIRNYLEHGGHGILVFDINDGHKFVKRILAGFDTNGVPLNVKGICASAATARLYVSTLQTLMCSTSYRTSCCGKNHTKAAATAWRFARRETIHLPSLEKEHWHIVDALTATLSRTRRQQRAHNTIVGPVPSRLSRGLEIAAAPCHGHEDSRSRPRDRPVQQFHTAFHDQWPADAVLCERE